MFEKVSPESVGIKSEKVLDFVKTLNGLDLATHSIIMAKGNKIFAEFCVKKLCKCCRGTCHDTGTYKA